jgi:hypothetical protein
MVRLHWVTEWQRRGVPHLHGAIWFPGKRYDLATPIDAWLAVAAPYGAQAKGQHAKMIDGPVGWFQYVSKHAARGVKHYQRSIFNIPEGWQAKTGRIWGHCGPWPLAEPRRFGLQGKDGDGGWYRLRRMVRGWRRAESRAAGDVWRIKSSRTMLKSSEPELSRLRGFSEWMPCDLVQLRMIAGVAELGHSVCDRDTGELLVAGSISAGDAGPRQPL